jgi:hypothetical protein
LASGHLNGSFSWIPVTSNKENQISVGHSICFDQQSPKVCLFILFYFILVI